MHSYTYDAENRIATVDGGATTYVYDANGQRVRKTVGGASTDYVYDLAEHAVAEVNASGWQRGEVYAGGRHLATYANSTTYFDHEDWLGTERVRTAVNGSVCESITSLPFGDGESTTGSCADASTRHFTGKERDTESGLDNFGARYDASSIGRFMSPDNPKFSEKTDPQSWNLYSYVSDNPLSRIDPTGHNWFYLDGGWQWHKGKKYTYTDASGNSQTATSDYTHLLVIQKTNQTTPQGAAVVNITLYDQDKVIGHGSGFTGGTGIVSVPNGNYEINLNNRGGVDTNRLTPVVAGLVLAKWHDGIQFVGNDLTYRGQSGYDATTEWGDMRANLSRGPGEGTPYYLHGKGLYFTEGHSYTAGCVCEPYEGVLKVIFNLDPSGVGEGNKNGRIAVSVNNQN